MEVGEGIEHGRPRRRRTRRAVAAAVRAARRGRSAEPSCPAPPPPPPGQPGRLEPEVAVEQDGVPLGRQRAALDRLVGDVVREVAHRDRRRVAAQLDVLGVPVAHAVGVDLRQHLRLALQHPPQLLVRRSRSAASAERKYDISSSRVSSFLTPSTSSWKVSRLVSIENSGEQPADAVGVLGVDELLGLLVERVAAEPALVLEEERDVGSGRGIGAERAGALLRQALPPQREEDDAVAERGELVVEPVAQRDRRLVLGVGREAQRGVSAQHRHLLAELSRRAGPGRRARPE